VVDWGWLVDVCVLYLLVPQTERMISDDAVDCITYEHYMEKVYTMKSVRFVEY